MSNKKKHGCYVSLVPNILSGFRIVLAFFFTICVRNSHIGIALAIFIIAAISDFLDGYTARRLKAESALGSILDPLADKCLMINSYFILGVMGLIPAWLCFIVIFRDIVILAVVCFCRYFRVSLRFHPLYSSKINTTIQLLYVITILACWYFLMDVPSLLYVCALITGVSTVYSAVDYARNYYWVKNAICSRKK